jgi:hypothetical protein
VPTNFEIVEVTDYIPMQPATHFGVEMDVHASEGKTLQIAVIWQGPGGSTLTNKTTAGSIRNGGQLKKSFSFAASDKPGKWLLKVFLIGIDSSINEIKSSDVALGSMKLYERVFEMYEA